MFNKNYINNLLFISYLDGRASTPSLWSLWRTQSLFVWPEQETVLSDLLTFRKTLHLLPLSLSSANGFVCLNHICQSWTVVKHGLSIISPCLGNGLEGEIFRPRGKELHISSLLWKNTRMMMPSFSPLCVLAFVIEWQWYQQRESTNLRQLPPLFNMQSGPWCPSCTIIDLLYNIVLALSRSLEPQKDLTCEGGSCDHKAPFICAPTSQTSTLWAGRIRVWLM